MGALDFDGTVVHFTRHPIPVPGYPMPANVCEEGGAAIWNGQPKRQGAWLHTATHDRDKVTCTACVEWLHA